MNSLDMFLDEDFSGEDFPSEDELCRVKSMRRAGSESPLHFVSDSGQNIHIDPEFADFDDDLSDDSEEEERRQEALQREIISWQSIAGKKMHELTPGQKRMKRVLESDVTADDVDKTFQNDFECLQYDSIPSPITIEATRELGPSPGRKHCFACQRGLGVVQVSNEKIEELEEMIKAVYPYTNKIAIATMVSNHFNEYIRKPANRELHKSETPLPPWTARSVFDHLTGHTNEPSFVLEDMKEMVKTHTKILLDNEVYRIPKNAKRQKVAVNKPSADTDGRHPSMLLPANDRDIRVNPVGHRMFMDSLKFWLQLTEKNPETMANSNTKFSVPKGQKSLFAPANKQASVPKSIFD